MVIEEYRPEGGVCRIPGICTTASGAVLPVYECRGGRSDWAEIDIALRRSDDGRELYVFYEKDEDDRMELCFDRFTL